MEPLSPFSAAPQKANRTALATGGSGPSCRAVSSTAATPEPALLMPGLSAGLSRWVPTITTSLADPVLVCASTFRDTTRTFSASSTSRTEAVDPFSAAAPLAPTTATGTVSWL